MTAIFVLALSLTLADAPEQNPGGIHGVVVNRSQGGAPCANTEVMLRVQKDGQFLPVEQTVTDAQGRFRFSDLPLGRQFLYLPGANHDDVHYPGSRLRLTGAHPTADVTLEVRDTIQDPCPLVIKHHEVIIRPEAGLLHVTESLRISNPSAKTYVGRAEKEGGQVVTLRLSIPRDFERTTFFEEFFGRQFAVADGQLVTGVPWTPGERDLRFMYTIRNEQRHRVWQRPVDLPCEDLRVRIVHDQPERIACNLEPASRSTSGEQIFSSRGQPLAADFVVRVELGHLPVPWTSYARWAALLLLAGLVVGTAGLLTFRKRARSQAADPAATAPPRRTRRHQRRQAA